MRWVAARAAARRRTRPRALPPPPPRAPPRADIERDEAKLLREAREYAKKVGSDSAGDRATLKGMARNIVASRRAVARIQVTKATLNSVSVTLQEQAGASHARARARACVSAPLLATSRASLPRPPAPAMAKVAGAMKKSTAVMQSMSKLVKAPEMALTMRKMGEEMRRAGIIDELVGDAMDDAMGGAELDEEADEVTERVIAELTAGIAGAAPSALKGGLPGAVRAPAAAAAHAGAGAPARVALPEGADDAAASRLDKF